jgi:hypothetical protein
MFPGARLQMAADGSTPLSFEPCSFTIVFSDGAESPAELVLAAGGASASGEAAVTVDKYTTRAGTTIPKKIWSVTHHAVEDTALILHIGRQVLAI